MERCFIISENSELYHDYMAWKTNVKKNNETMKEFLYNMGIETSEYSLSDRLGIVVTESDLEKFKNQLTRQPVQFCGKLGLYEFKKNSPVGKAYTALGLKVIYKPNVAWCADILVRSCQTRCFMHNGILYVTMEADEIKSDTEFPDGWNDIKRSDFYKMLEESNLEG